MAQFEAISLCPIEGEKVPSKPPFLQAKSPAPSAVPSQIYAPDLSTALCPSLDTLKPLCDMQEAKGFHREHLRVWKITVKQ